MTSIVTPKRTTKCKLNAAGGFICIVCGELGKNRAAVSRHYDTQHVPKSAWKHACTHEGCAATFPQKCELTQHIKYNHPAAAATSKAATFACPFCEHSSPTKGNIITHIGRKHGKGVWIPEGKGDVIVCKSCHETKNSATSYYNHAVSCFSAPADITEKLIASGYLKK